MNGICGEGKKVENSVANKKDPATAAKRNDRFYCASRRHYALGRALFCQLYSPNVVVTFLWCSTFVYFSCFLTHWEHIRSFCAAVCRKPLPERIRGTLASYSTTMETPVATSGDFLIAIFVNWQKSGQSGWVVGKQGRGGVET